MISFIQLAMILFGTGVGLFILLSGLRTRIPEPYIEKPLCKGRICVIVPWLLIFFVTVGLIGSLNGPLYYDLIRANETSSATITAVDHAHHCSASYRFDANRHAYKGREAMCAAEVGMTKTVYYDPDDPYKSSLYQPIEAFLNELIPAGMAGFVLATVLLNMLMRMGFLAWRRTSPVEEAKTEN